MQGRLQPDKIAEQRRCRRRVWLGPFVAAAALLFGLPVASAQESGIAIELNKLEPQGKQCRAYIVVQNKSGTEYQQLKLDLVLFRPDGIIGRRFAVDLAPLKPNKRSVKLFDLEDTPCDQVGSFLINDVMECKAESGPIADCLKDITTSTLTNVQLAK